MAISRQIEHLAGRGRVAPWQTIASLLAGHHGRAGWTAGLFV